MILVTLGTHDQPFERALRLAEPLASQDEVVVQHGHTPPPSWCEPSRCLRFVEYEQLAALVEEADAVVSHAGVGTIVTALGYGKTPVVIPRLARYGEHVDDHQMQIANAFAERGLVVVCDGDLAGALAVARGRAAARRGPSERLKRAVVEAARGSGRPATRLEPRHS